MSTFSGLNTAYTGLVAAKAGLDVVGQNLVNANTAGYTRQRVTTSGVPALNNAGLFSGGVRPGQGVSVDGIQRLDDAALDARVRTTTALAGYSSTRAQALATLEGSLNEPGTNGISAQLQKFWSAWGDVANQAGEQAPVGVLLGQAGSLVTQIAAGYRAAKETGSAFLPDLIESVEAYGLYAAWHGGFEMVAPDYVPGLILTQEERRELGELGHLSASTVERLDAASSARQEEAREREKQAEAETKAKQAAADRAKHGPPTAERLIPLLPSFSEKAREAASSILINADMMSTIHGMIAKHAAVLQTHELEELRRFDITMLKDRFEAETQDILRQELDRLIRGRQAGMAT